MAPRVRMRHVEAIGEPPARLSLQTVIRRVRISPMYSHCTEHRSAKLPILRISKVQDSACISVPRSRSGAGNRVVVFTFIAEFPARVSDVANFKEPVSRKLVLKLKVPLLDVGGSEAWVEKTEVHRSEFTKIDAVAGLWRLVGKRLRDRIYPRAEPGIGVV